jgi:CheY-like chemotaxis protein
MVVGHLGDDAGPRALAEASRAQCGAAAPACVAFGAASVPDCRAVIPRPCVSPALLIEALSLSAGARDHALLESPPDQPVELHGGDLRVLLVDDNATNAVLGARLLQKFGCRVEVARDGHEAVRAFTQQSFDLIFMDCHMPRLDGLAATREIRRLEPAGQRIPIVAMTASVLDDDRRLCIEAGMDDMLSKPVSPALLRLTLSRWTRAAARCGASCEGRTGVEPGASGNVRGI